MSQWTRINRYRYTNGEWLVKHIWKNGWVAGRVGKREEYAPIWRSRADAMRYADNGGR